MQSPAGKVPLGTHGRVKGDPVQPASQGLPAANGAGFPGENEECAREGVLRIL
jgi:hypothetical protein